MTSDNEIYCVTASRTLRRGGLTNNLVRSGLSRTLNHKHRIRQDLTSIGYLLILDGHNSHTTYCFCSFAEKHKIIILCIPPHTTHCLQPYDVGVFGLLSSTWKAEVNAAGEDGDEICKSTFIRHYAHARQKAFTKETILGAWRKTGLCPLDCSAIPEIAYEPALNTPTQA